MRLRPRSLLILVSVALVTAVPVWAQEQQQEQRPPSSNERLFRVIPFLQDVDRDDVLIIDGSVEPRKVPEWKKWEVTFRFLAERRPPADQLHVSSDERDMLLAEADAHVDATLENRERVQPIADALNQEGRPYEERWEGLWKYELERRWQIIDAASRVRSALDPDHAAMLETEWITPVVLFPRVFRFGGPAKERFNIPF